MKRDIIGHVRVNDAPYEITVDLKKVPKTYDLSVLCYIPFRDYLAVIRQGLTGKPLLFWKQCANRNIEKYTVPSQQNKL
ncbi:hypothetical protein [Methanosarcina sp. UBA411]|uniref:hypothetical protein n=1 Tax=Methanosarcina sp. UBA411 TaxID=1915589 RepID=UPI0025F069DA|nr:hypothetical protein [Methanosarcina sp. UBA411]